MNRAILAIALAMLGAAAWAHGGSEGLVGIALAFFSIPLAIVLIPPIAIACSKVLDFDKKANGFFIALVMTFLMCVLMFKLLDSFAPYVSSSLGGGILFLIAVSPSYVFWFWYVRRFGNTRRQSVIAGTKDAKR